MENVLLLALSLIFCNCSSVFGYLLHFESFVCVFNVELAGMTSYSEAIGEMKSCSPFEDGFIAQWSII